MDNNLHLHIAKFLLENREIAKTLATIIDTTLEAMDAQVQRELQRYISIAESHGQTGYSISLSRLKKYWISKYQTDISAVAGVNDYNPHGCEGEQIYKFIQAFTAINVDFISNYTQAEFNALDEEDSPEEAYMEQAYHEFTASGGCRD